MTEIRSRIILWSLTLFIVIKCGSTYNASTATFTLIDLGIGTQEPTPTIDDVSSPSNNQGGGSTPLPEVTKHGTLTYRTPTNHGKTEIYQSHGTQVTTGTKKPLMPDSDPMKLLELILKSLPFQIPNTTDISDMLGIIFNQPWLLQNFFYSRFSNFGLSKQCSASLQHVGQSIFRHELPKDSWALQVLDAIGKPRSGLMSGNIYWMGDYDECLRVQVPESLQMSTQYCKMKIAIPSLGVLLPFQPGTQPSVNLGLCVPSNCTSEEIKTIITESTNTSSIHLIPTEVECLTYLTWDTGAIILIIVIGFITTLVLFATFFDGYVRWSTKPPEMDLKDNRITMTDITCEGNMTEKSNGTTNTSKDVDQEHFVNINVLSHVNNYKLKSGTPKTIRNSEERSVCLKLLTSFSVLTNLEKMFNTSQGSDALGAVNGIRFFSMSWVILGHSFGFVPLTTSSNVVVFYQENLQKWTFMAVTNGVFAVDTFFLLSGLLLSYLFLNEITKKNGQINWFKFYFHRFWRLTPLYMMVLWISTLLGKYLTYGPAEVDQLQNDLCLKYWYRNLAYINNLFPSTEMCFSISWYLANDMQFYVISPLILLPMYFSKRFRFLGHAVTAVFLLGATITPIVVSAVKELPITFSSIKPLSSTADYMDTYYFRPYCRMGPYIIGMYLGYFLFKNKCKAKINKYKALLLWGVSIILACTIIYGVFEASKGNHPSVAAAALYNGTSRSLWAICVAWVIFACVTGNGGYINSFLSWKPFAPLARLTYSAYLVHATIISVYLSAQRQPFDARVTTVVYFFLANMMTSYLVSVVVSLLFESPMIGLEKIIFKRNKT